MDYEQYLIKVCESNFICLLEHMHERNTKQYNNYWSKYNELTEHLEILLNY